MRIEVGSAPRLVALAVALGSLSGCPGKLSDKQEFLDYAAAHPNTGVAGDDPAAAGAASTDPCGDVVTRIFVPSCGGTSCHGATAPQQGLDLVSPDVTSRVVGISAKVCGSTLVDPQNPQASLMYQKLLPLPKCGAQMPLARPPLSGSDTACVLAWIAAQ